MISKQDRDVILNFLWKQPVNLRMDYVRDFLNSIIVCEICVKSLDVCTCERDQREFWEMEHTSKEGEHG